MVGQTFTTTYNGISNTLKNEVKIESSVIEPKTIPTTNWVALWDTGATRSVITKNVVEKLQLKPVSMAKACTPQGSYDAFLYYIDLFLPNGVFLPKLLVMEGQPFGCDVLIGMDVIGRGDFAVSNFEGQTVFSYRYPSYSKLDFVNNSYLQPIVKRDTPNGPAKNSKCPCGSGKKYKQCHGKDNRHN